jgi:hypothetical protein
MGFFNKLFKRNIEGIVAPNQYYNPTTDDYEVIQGSNGAAQVSLAGSNGVKVTVNPDGSLNIKIAGIDEVGGALPTKEVESTIIKPVDIQARYAQPIQTHNAVSVGASSSVSGTWVDTSGFSEIGVTMLNDSATNSGAFIQFSNDGVTLHGEDVINTITSNNQQRKSGSKPISARYARLVLINGDTVAHIMSAWMYLKV